MGGKRSKSQKANQAQPAAAADNNEPAAAGGTTEAPMTTEATTEKKGRGRGLKPMSEATRAQAIATRRQASIFNRYLKAGSKKAGKFAEEIKQIDTVLAQGKRMRKVPVMVKRPDGKMAPVGSAQKMVALRPTEKAALLQRKADLISGDLIRKNAGLRDEFLAILPEFARRKGLSLATLRTLGVTDRDLKDAGLLPAA